MSGIDWGTRTKQGYPNSTTAVIKNWLPGGNPLVYATEVLADSPYFYWRVGETSGTTASDSSGNGRNATYFNSPTLNQTPLITVNRCVDLDGTNDYLQWTSTAAVTGNFSMECWINGDSFSNYPGFISGWNANSSGNYGSHLVVKDTNSTVEIYAANSTFTNWSYTDNTSYALSTGVTYHLVFVNDDTNNVGYLYSNGDLVYTTGTKTTAMGLWNSGKRVVAGAAALSPVDGFFNGRMDEIAVYTTALSAARIKRHYLAGIGGVEL